MKLSDLVTREAPKPWAGRSKLPWNDPGFSRRMLREHLSQQHDRASRRLDTIDRQVGWIHRTLLRGESGHVLDLGCGPGLYTSRLAMLGHTCVGLDFSPASIARARSEAERQGLACDYRLQDLRDGDFGSGFQGALFIFGELNTFSPREAQTLVSAAHRALAPSGFLILEVHTEAFVQEMGGRPPTWYTMQRGLFSDRPHLVLCECRWHPQARATTERFFVIDAETNGVTSFDSTTQAYSNDEYVALLREGGFTQFEWHPSLEGIAAAAQEGVVVMVAWRERA